MTPPLTKKKKIVKEWTENQKRFKVRLDGLDEEFKKYKEDSKKEIKGLEN